MSPKVSTFNYEPSIPNKITVNELNSLMQVWRLTELDIKGPFTRSISHCIVAFRELAAPPENAQAE
jgi:hypothetical protein